MRFRNSVILIAFSATGLLAGCDRGAGGREPAANEMSNPVNAAANGGNAATPSAQARLALFASGLETIDARGSRTSYNFGDPIAGVLAGLNGKFGAPSDDNVNTDCGSGSTRIVRWSNGLRILAQDDQLQGWEVERPGLYALGDLQVGMARAALEANRARFEQTGLGTVWTVADANQAVSGLVGDDGIVTAMWAGLTCHAT